LDVLDGIAIWEEIEMSDKTLFPIAGEFFGVVCSYMQDHSYRTDIFECTGSDESRVVCKSRTHSHSSDPMIFHRSEWHFEDVSGILSALGIIDQSAAKEFAASAIDKARIKP
jgi:hypothetical protein